MPETPVPAQVNPRRELAEPRCARWERNQRHWERTLDAQNLGERDAGTNIRQQVELYKTLDVRWAIRELVPLRERWLLDLGGGLALAAILFAREGAQVIICDVSLPRLRAARDLTREAGVEDRVALVVAKAEALPLAKRSMDRVFTKSVLIHTELTLAAAEVGRILAADGRAVFIEPMRRNPLVNLYRWLAAPRIWREITTYFGPGEFRHLCRGLGAERGTLRVFYFLGFFASAFQFAVPIPAAARVLETALFRVDRALFRAFPSLRQRAWFGALSFRTDSHRRSGAVCGRRVSR